VNKSLNSICSSYKVIESLQNIWTKPLNSFGNINNKTIRLLEETKIIRVCFPRIYYF